MPDRIELGTYMIAAALATAPGDSLVITGAAPGDLGDAFLDAFAATGVPFTLGDGTVEVRGADRVAPVSIATAPYPGFPTDLQAQWTVLMTQADGPSEVTDTIYLDRFKHIPELNRMGVRPFASTGEAVTWLEKLDDRRQSGVMRTMRRLLQEE